MQSLNIYICIQIIYRDRSFRACVIFINDNEHVVTGSIFCDIERDMWGVWFTYSLSYNRKEYGHKWSPNMLRIWVNTEVEQRWKMWSIGLLCFGVKESERD